MNPFFNGRAVAPPLAVRIPHSPPVLGHLAHKNKKCGTVSDRPHSKSWASAVATLWRWLFNLQIPYAKLGEYRRSGGGEAVVFGFGVCLVCNGVPLTVARLYSPPSV